MATRLEAFNESKELTAIGDKLHNLNLFKAQGDVPTVEIEFARKVQELQKVRQKAYSSFR